MAINRFYQPSRGQYQSQFVPEQLPAELMMGVLGSKQKQYNDLSEKIQTNIYDWNQEALPGFDTQYRDKMVKALPILRERGIECEYVIGGVGYQEDFLNQLARDLKVENNFKILS